MADEYRVIDQDGRVTQRGSLRDGGFTMVDENSNPLIVISVKGRVIIPFKWLAWQAASGNLRTKIESTKMQETISGRWMLKAIQYGLKLKADGLEEVEEYIGDWNYMADFVLVSTKGKPDVELRMKPRVPIEVFDAESNNSIDGDPTARRLFYFKEYSGVNVWKLKGGDLKACVLFQDYNEERRFNQTMINMCQNRVTLEHMLQFTHPMADPQVDALFRKQA